MGIGGVDDLTKACAARTFDDGYTAFDRERWAVEPPKTSTRTAFQRDRARVIHSSAFRRLGAKTQVLVAGSDDFARTRLTHTLEVAQIGRQIAESLGSNPDVVDCACLAHDLGHPPFGHNGERALASLAGGIGGFEGNAQTLRLLTRLEPKFFLPDGRSAGVNLTRTSLDAAVKYPWTAADAPLRADGTRSPKFCVYPDDLPMFQWLKRDNPHCVKPTTTAKPVECQIMDLSDDIAYSVHDVEDGIVCGSINPTLLHDGHVIDAIVESARQWYGETWDGDGLVRAFDRLRAAGMLPERFDGSRRSLAVLKNLTSAQIGRFADSVERATRERHGSGPLTRYHASLVIPEETAYEITALKGVAVHFVMAPHENDAMHRRQRRIIEELVDALMDGTTTADGGRSPSPLLEPVFLDDWRRASDDNERLRVAIDQVASLTDTSAMTLHRRLHGMERG
ncbi:deoxyguanosinetriphosphate triphosphohydrolase [Bifidobacterium vansinderenii]|uniref:Deoxyguanosinetriphosphate triphosphohydrolase n=1 Tax=Bifidobacterium vansinderenii TaxID=1984871 RepID=A0A229VYU9_9BIFI|nr:deoxyguanosinetriphosphate triphosphohydrolase [Bifidobacterium vansinderenii]OXN00787.1 deoxyguanosinetriphosphate triphosphohydrolase [Bifidobacterium vansinderenii]